MIGEESSIYYQKWISGFNQLPLTWIDKAPTAYLIGGKLWKPFSRQKLGSLSEYFLTFPYVLFQKWQVEICMVHCSVPYVAGFNLHVFFQCHLSGEIYQTPELLVWVGMQPAVVYLVRAKKSRKRRPAEVHLEAAKVRGRPILLVVFLRLDQLMKPGWGLRQNVNATVWM